MTVALIYFYALPINFAKIFCKCLQLEILTERPTVCYNVFNCTLCTSQ